ncbi:MAG: AgmX/PglI C-terminal domain-containing protein [Gammaproteobacteria bacterium]|nr:AgmX/PglI C-terminal domain-containing protein [Gammaproteobacteria bacterium]
MTVYHHHPDLPWNVSTRDERRFRTISTTALACALLVGLIMSYITVPKPPREEAEQVPPRLAKMIIERKKLPPPPPPKQETVKKEDLKKAEEPIKPKPQPAPKAEMKIEPKPVAKTEPVPPPAETPPPKVDIEAARKKAASTGLLALSNDLAALRDKPVVPNPSDEKLAHPGKDEPFVQRAMITSGTARAGSSAAAVPPALASRNLNGAKLSERATTRVTSPEATRQASVGETSTPKTAPAAKGGRSDAELQMAFDKNKGALYSLYKRAQRQDPNLQGRVVLKLTIDPSGKVSACDVVSSELDSQELIQKIVARVLMFDFGSEDTGTAVKTFSIDFVPTS